MLAQIQISTLGQYSYCPRRCALMYVENTMVHNEHTVAGEILHEVVDDADSQKRKDTTRLHALPLYSDSLGLVGKADLVEVIKGVPYPVEFKKGRKANWDNNRIQLCAQAMCLEEMFGVPVCDGAIFNLATKKRFPIIFSDEDRQSTLATILRVRELFISQITPAAKLGPQCEGCSLHETCMPEITDLGSASRIAKISSKLFHGVED